MAKLTDLELERVDGVSEPATRQRFLILKAEEPDELRHNVQELLAKVEAALRALAKAEDLYLPLEAVEALNEVAKALDLGITFKAKKKPKDDEEDEDEEEGYGYPPPEKPSRARKDADVLKALEQISARLDEHEEALKAIIDRLLPVRKSAPASRQPKVQDPVAKQRDPWHEIFFGR